jgi:small subunit ribosomal protein S9
MREDERQDEPQRPDADQPEAERPEAEQPEVEQQEGVPGEPGEGAQEREPEAGPAEEAAEPAAEEAAEPEAEEQPPEERPRPRRRRRKEAAGQEEVIPGAHLEPDLVLEEEREEGEYGEFPAAEVVEEAPPEEEPEEAEQAPEPVAREPLDLAADARYRATGKRKAAVARVTLKPGDGTYQINGRHLDEFFPRIKLQRMARQPLEVAGYGSRMDVAARVHGGGVAAQAGALRHGIARALVEADPNLRLELKRRGYLTRDPRVKERKKAGLKKARKRPQFSKR